MNADPTALLSSISDGDENAFKELHAAFSGALYGVVLRTVQREELAQEVLQDTFLKIWRNASSYDPAKGRPFTWMVNIARHAAIDALRSAEVKHSSSIRSLDDHVYAHTGEVTAPSSDGADVRSLLTGLKIEHRELLDLAYYKGYSQQEISTRTGLPLGTVKSRTRTALLELRTLLKDHR